MLVLKLMGMVVRAGVSGAILYMAMDLIAKIHTLQLDRVAEAMKLIG